MIACGGRFGNGLGGNGPGSDGPAPQTDFFEPYLRRDKVIWRRPTRVVNRLRKNRGGSLPLDQKPR